MRFPRLFSSVDWPAAPAAWLLAVFAALPLRAEEPAKLAPILQPFVDRHVVAGAVVLVANAEKVLDVETVGYSSLGTKAPMQANDLFWIASMTKSFTATGLMMLVDEGKVKIDDPVEKYLPEFKGQKVAGATPEEAPHAPQHPITIKEILSHTSGLATPRSIKATYSLKDDVAQYAAIPLLREPSTKYEYNNAGIDTAGRIIEVVSGKAYADFMQERIFGPLGLKDTTFWPNEEQGQRIARSVRLTADKSTVEEVNQGKELTPEVLAKISEGVTVPTAVLAEMGRSKISEYIHHYAMPAGGLFSTAADVGRFCQMLLNGGNWEGRRYLSPEAIQLMTSNQLGSIPLSPDEAYGLGWSVKLKDNEGPSVGSFGHRGARRTVMWVDPKNRLVMVLLIERFDMPGNEQKEIYSAFQKGAIERFGRAQ